MAAMSLREPPLFNAVPNDYDYDWPLRYQPVRIIAVLAAVALQEYLERAEWVTMPGDLTLPNPCQTNLVRAANLRETTAVYRHDLALKGDGTVWAWGYNGSGQLGDGITASRGTPVQVAGLSGVAGIGAAGYQSLAAKRDGTVWAWGAKEFGRLDRSKPVQVVPPGLPDLAIARSHASDFPAGDRGIYTLTIANVGLTPTDGAVTVTDTLPPGLTHLSGIGIGWTCSATDPIFTCTNPGPINPGASSTIALAVHVELQAWPGVTNLATVSNQSDRNTANNAIGDPTVVLATR